MSSIGWAQRHRRSILLLVLLLVAGGAASSFILPVTLFPHVDFPRVVISLEVGDRPADQMLTQVTIPVEEAVRLVPGLRTVRSTTSRGEAEISINFDWGQDMVTAMLQTQSAVAQALPELPPGTAFTVRRMDPTVFPILGYTFVSDSRSLVELRDLAQYQLRPILSTVTGVSRIDVQGGAVEEYRVTVDPARLQSLGLTVKDVTDALAATNVIEAVGRIEDHYKLYLVMSNSQFKRMDEINNAVLRAGPSGAIRLSDAASVTRETEPQWTRVTADGHDAVIVQIYQQPDGNNVQIARDVRAKFHELSEHIPPDVHIATWYDQSELVQSAAAGVRDAVLIGMGLSAIVLFVFLRNVKVTLIAILTVPGVLAASMLILEVLHMSLNIMTLGGMAAAVGLIIDDAIVMVEHIMRRLRHHDADTPAQHHGRVLVAAAEFARPLAGSSAATVIIFAPLAFLGGVTGAFFKALSLTMAASLVLSFFVALLAVPLLSDFLLTRKDADQDDSGWVRDRLRRGYESGLGLMLRQPWIALLLVVPIAFGGWLAYERVGSGFMPAMDEGGFILDYISPPGTSLTETDRMLRQVETILRATPEVQTYSRRTGLQLGGGLTEANTGDFFVKLKPTPRRDIEEVMDDVRSNVEHSVPGLEIELLQLMEDLIGDLIANPQPIEIKLYADDEASLRATAPKVAELIGAIKGVVDIKDGIVIAGDALEIRVDRIKAGLQGLDPEKVTQVLADYLTGNAATKMLVGPKVINVRVWIPSRQRRTDLDLANLRIPAADGHMVALDRIATIEPVIGQPEITRDNLKRMVPVTGRISGRDLGSTIAEVKAALDKPGALPAQMHYELGGLYAIQQTEFAGLTAVFVAAVLLVFLLIVFLYERFRMAVFILICTLLAVPAVFIGLWITGTEQNISSMMGLTMVVGIVTEVSIFYCSEYQEILDLHAHHARLIAAGANRMRPIAMTTLAAILALLPLAISIGEGSAMLRPLAIAIISGLCVQLPLVLLVLPVLLSLSPPRSQAAA